MRKLKVLQRNEERRNCLKLIFSGLAVATGLPRTSAGSEAPPAEKALPALPEGDSPLLRMQYELHRALKKPIEQRRWVMVIDRRKCIGCRFCMAACPYNAKFFNWHTYEKEQPGQNSDVSLRPIIVAIFASTACRWENFACRAGIRRLARPTPGLQSSATVR